jgi:hypothetical protein
VKKILWVCCYPKGCGRADISAAKHCGDFPAPYKIIYFHIGIFNIKLCKSALPIWHFCGRGIGTNKASEQLGVAKSTLSTWRSNKERHREATFVGSGNERITP